MISKIDFNLEMKAKAEREYLESMGETFINRSMQVEALSSYNSLSIKQKRYLIPMRESKKTKYGFIETIHRESNPPRTTDTFSASMSKPKKQPKRVKLSMDDLIRLHNESIKSIKSI